MDDFRPLLLGIESDRTQDEKVRQTVKRAATGAAMLCDVTTVRVSLNVFYPHPTALHPPSHK